MGELEDEI
jgi:hypothetical protein